MAIFLRIVIGCIGVFGLLALVIYCLLSQKGKSLILYGSWYPDGRLYLFRDKVLLFLTFGCFFICLFVGCYKILFWLPGYWGDYEGGNGITFRELISLIFSIYCGYVLSVKITYANRIEYLCKEYEVKIKETERILLQANNLNYLNNLIVEYEEKVKHLRKAAENYGKISRHIGNTSFLPEGQMALVYLDLIDLVEKRIESIDK